MEIALLTDVFKRYSLEEALRLTWEAGFGAIELNACFDWSPHIDFLQADAPRRVESLGRALAELDLKLLAVATYPNIAAINEAVREQAVEYCLRAISLCKPLGCPLLTLMTSGSNLLPYEPQRAALEDSLRRLSAAAEGDMAIAIEVYPGNFIESTDEVLELIDSLGLENVGYLLCVPHLAALGEDIAEAYRKARGRVFHIHLADTPLATDSHLHLVPGTGDIEFGEFFDLLRTEYDRSLSIQIYSEAESPLASSRQSLEIVKQWLARR